jgi:hypothetical protein
VKLRHILCTAILLSASLFSAAQNPLPTIAIPQIFTVAGVGQPVQIYGYLNHLLVFSPSTNVAVTGCLVQVDTGPTAAGPWTAGGAITSAACNAVVGAGGSVSATSVAASWTRVNVTTLTGGVPIITYIATGNTSAGTAGATNATIVNPVDGSGYVNVDCKTGCAGGATTPTDAFANPTTAGLQFGFNALFNGTTWDRWRSMAAGQNVASTGLAGNYCGFNTSPTTITTGNFSPVQCDSVANLLVNLKTALPAGANIIGAVTQSGLFNVNQAIGVAGFEKVTDGANTAAVKAASTAAAATDPALVVAISPNNNIPTQVVGFGAIFGTQQAVTASAVALPSNAGHGFCVKALPTNALTIYVGQSGITTATGYPLGPGDSICYQVTNSNLIFVISTSTGSSVAFSGV